MLGRTLPQGQLLGPAQDAAPPTLAIPPPPNPRPSAPLQQLSHASMIAHKAKSRRCMNSTAKWSARFCWRDSSAAASALCRRRLAPLQVSSLTFSANRTGCRSASAFCVPSIHRYYPVANYLIDIASQPDSESTSTTASTSTTRPPLC